MKLNLTIIVWLFVAILNSVDFNMRSVIIWLAVIVIICSEMQLIQMGKIIKQKCQK